MDSKDCSISTAIYVAASALVLLIVILVYYMIAGPRERMEPYASWLSYNMPRSDAQFDDRPGLGGDHWTPIPEHARMCFGWTRKLNLKKVGV